mgnify:CR=1 FL=1
MLYADLFRNLGLGNQINLPAGASQLGAISFVMATYLLLVLQEGVEWRRFIKDPGPWEGIWTFSDVFVTIVQGATSNSNGTPYSFASCQAPDRLFMALRSQGHSLCLSSVCFLIR